MSTTTQAPNGYTIRLELLKMAKDMLEQDWHAARDIAMTSYHTKVEFANAKASSLGFQNTDFPALPTLPTFPTEDQIIAKARTLNEFVATR